MMETLLQWWQAVDWTAIGVWTMTVSLMLVGVAGAILPFLPGPLILFLAALLHTWLLPQSGMSTWGIVLLAVLLIVSYVADMASGAMGAKWFGASRWGILGVILGGLVGLFFGFLGLIIGPIIGGLVFEVVVARRNWREGVKSTWGSVVGTGVGLVMRLMLSFGMVVAFFIDALW
jgi:uncharacterized protein YqgC (DUF456 family)